MTLADAVARIHEAEVALAQADPRPFPLPIAGLAPVVAGAIAALEKDDWWVPGLRERIGAVLRGVPVAHLADGTAGAPSARIAPPSPSPALRALTAVGLALSGDGGALVHLGIGSTSDGAFAEALNLAALTGAPVVFLVAVHPLDGDAPVGPQSAADPVALARAHGIATTSVDGTDAAAVHAAVTAARATGAPHLVCANL